MMSHIECVMSSREWVSYNRYSGLDDTDGMDVVSDIVGEMADITCVVMCVMSYIVCVMS